METVPSKPYVFQVYVYANSVAEAEQVMMERLDPEEDYGYPYTVTWATE